MKILLAEDEMNLGALVYRILCQEEYIVDWVKDGDTAWSYLEHQDYHYTIAILNLTLPGVSGLELCQKLRKHQNPVFVMLLTTFERWEDGIAGLDAGADDCLVKPFRREELLARLRALRRRSPQFRPLQLQFGSLVLDCDNRSLSWQVSLDDHRSVVLSKKEFQLLEYLMQHPHRGINQESLLFYLYQAEAERTSNVVAAQVRRLRRRLAKIGCQDAIQTLPGGFYRLNPDFQRS